MRPLSCPQAPPNTKRRRAHQQGAIAGQRHAGREGQLAWAVARLAELHLQRPRRCAQPQHIAAQLVHHPHALRACRAPKEGGALQLGSRGAGGRWLPRARRAQRCAQRAGDFTPQHPNYKWPARRRRTHAGTAIAGPQEYARGCELLQKRRDCRGKEGRATAVGKRRQEALVNSAGFAGTPRPLRDDGGQATRQARQHAKQPLQSVHAVTCTLVASVTYLQLGAGRQPVC